MISKRWMFLLPLTFFFSILSGTGQTSNPPGALFETIKSLDAKLFDAYNHCNLETLGSMVSDDLEFYHDQTGLMVGKAPFLQQSSRTSAVRYSVACWRIPLRSIR